jgi:hypothetical protein
MVNNIEHKCKPPNSADKSKPWICSECKLTWTYEEGLYLLPDPNLQATWNAESLVKRKTRERHERLASKRKRY